MVSSFRAFVITQCFFLAVQVPLGPPGAKAHVVYDRRTLRQWTQEADVVVVAQFRTAMQVWRAADGSDAQEFFTVRVLESIQGPPTATDLDFFSHAEGEPRWRPGDVALLFLDRTAERAEFAPLAERFSYFSVQGAGHEWTLAPLARNDIVGAARGWSGLKTPAPPDALRALLLRELRSAAASLQSDGLTELVYARAQPALFPDPTSVEAFVQLVNEGPLQMPSRVALALALDGCPGFDVAAALRQMTMGPLAPRERSTLIRAAGMTKDPTLGDWLVTLLSDPDPLVRREAIAALGHPWHVSRIPPLVQVAVHDGDTVALAAVRTLAAIATPEAQAALAELTRDERMLVANAARGYLKQAALTPPR